MYYLLQDRRNDKFWNVIIISYKTLGGFSGVHEGQLACLARTNVKLFEQCVNTIITKPHLKVASMGGFKSSELNFLLAIHHYMKRKNLHLITNPFIRSFLGKPFNEFEEYADKTESTNLMHKIRVSYCSLNYACTYTYMY